MRGGSALADRGESQRKASDDSEHGPSAPEDSLGDLVMLKLSVCVTRIYRYCLIFFVITVIGIIVSLTTFDKRWR